MPQLHLYPGNKLMNFPNGRFTNIEPKGQMFTQLFWILYCLDYKETVYFEIISIIGLWRYLGQYPLISLENIIRLSTLRRRFSSEIARPSMALETNRFFGMNISMLAC